MSKRIEGRLMMALPILLLAFVVTAQPVVATAAELVACEVLQSDDSVRIEITANGEWTHRSFRANDPERFVLDLVGVQAGSVSPRIAADGRFVNAVRTAQYQGGENPVTRVVLDLVEGTRVSVEPAPDGLALVAFGSSAPADAHWASSGWTEPGAESVVYKSAPTEWPAEAAGADHWQGEGVGRIANTETEDTSYARTMSLNMQNADVRTVLRAVADFSGRNIISSPDVKGTVTVAITDMPWREALGAILKANGFGYVDEDNIIRVDTADKLREEEMAEKAAAQRVAELEPLVTKIIEIDFANADEVKESVRAILSNRGKIETDTRTNALVVNDRPEIVDRITDLARELDTRTPQVHIDALMVDLDTRRTRELGVDWYASSLSGASHGDPYNGLSPSDLEGGGGVLRPLTDVAGRVNVGIIDDWGGVRAEIQALAGKNLANIVSNPRITTTDNREASILVGQKIPLITQDVAGNPMTQLETIGIRLIVTPHINSDRQITLDVHPEVSDLSSQATVQGGVIINTSEADTRVLVANGETAVIAGLIRNLVSDYDSGVPVLKDIPLLGNLFKTSNKIKQQRELVVFLTPQIVEVDDSVGTDRDWEIREDIQGAIEDGHNPVLR
jgi:type IV pilus assembly protein PilQ